MIKPILGTKVINYFTIYLRAAISKYRKPRAPNISFYYFHNKIFPKTIVDSPPGLDIESIENFIFIFIPPFWVARQFGPTCFVHDLYMYMHFVVEKVVEEVHVNVCVRNTWVVIFLKYTEK